ncbi:hypothetical protein D3C80_2001070 [compost metagenome]
MHRLFSPAGVAVLFKIVTRTQHQILSTVTGKRRVEQGKGTPRYDTQRGSRCVDALMLRLPLLLAHPGVGFAVAVLHEVPRPVVVVNLAR